MISRIFSFLFLFFAASPFHGMWQDEEGSPKATLGQNVNEAIEKGIEYLRGEQLANGSFREETDQFADGYSALCMLAMLKSGVHYKDPAIQKNLNFLRYKPFTKTYSTAVRIMAYEALRDAEKEPVIRQAAQWLVDNIDAQKGEWVYPEHNTDLSNTQYAVLGLWTAERHGFKTPNEVWTKLVPAVIIHQNEDGGFCYSSDGGESTGSMTTAGVFTLSICLEKIQGNGALKAEIRHSLAKGWGYLDKRFSVIGNPTGEHTYSSSRLYYYLYGLERCCAVSNRLKVGGRDWYREGAVHLVKCQAGNGSWAGPAETCFGLLFLRRSTYTIISRKKTEELEGSGPDVEEQVRPKQEVPFAHNWLLLGPFDNPGEANFEKDLIDEEKVDPRAGTTKKKQRWTTQRAHGSTVVLDKLFPESNGCLAYGFTRVRAESDMDALIWFGSDDGARIFLDGNLVFHNPFRCSEGPDHHMVPVTLSKGDHCLLVKVMQWDGAWKFALRISGAGGEPLPGLVTYTGEKGPTFLERFDSTSVFMSPREMFDMLPRDRDVKLDFSSKDDPDRLFVSANGHQKPMERFHPKEQGWSRAARKEPSAMTFHIMHDGPPVRIVRKVKVPSKRYGIKAVLSALKHDDEATDFVVRIGFLSEISEGSSESITWFPEELVTTGTEAFPDGWKEITGSLSEHAGEELLIILECGRGGDEDDDWWREKGCLKEFSLAPSD